MLTFPTPVQNRASAGNKVIVAQLGSRQDYTVPIAFQTLGCLERFYTDTYFNPWEARSLRQLERFKPLRQLAHRCLSRSNSALDSGRVARLNLFGLRYLHALQTATSKQAHYQAYIDYGQAFNQIILQKGLPEASHLYAFDHAALSLFELGRSRGMHCVLDQIYPALYAERMEHEEEQRWQGWSRHPQTTFYESPIFQRWCDIQQQEWQLADTILVASSYSYRAIAATVPEVTEKLHIVPLTVNLEAYCPYQHIRQFKGDRPLRVLFVGKVNLLKGIPYLLQALQSLDPQIAELTIAGECQLQAEKLAPFQDRASFLGAVPHTQIPQIYHDADVLVFPTISDGFGAVLLEAMATGLPVIATDRCADLVEDGVNGRRIPIREPEAIAEAIRQLWQQPEQLTHLSEGAIATSQQFSLAHYQSRLIGALRLGS
ncbi:MAG: glycosyltransferase family 4 protein [Leptolyngbyaceae cyanobacterium RU_5_1]|nr:glycosyltransferase family 4 protein [Leptolyngbyaceae cyanobacterium RU_5_1]